MTNSITVFFKSVRKLEILLYQFTIPTITYLVFLFNLFLSSLSFSLALTPA